MSENWQLSDEDVQVPLGVGEEGAARETAFVEPRKSVVNAATLALVGVFLGSLAMIYLLGLQNRPRSAAAQGGGTGATDSAIAELLSKAGKAGDIKSVFQNTDQLVQIFYNYPGYSAAEPSDLPGNPFEQPGVRRTITITPQAPGASVALKAAFTCSSSAATLKPRLQSASVTQTALVTSRSCS